LPIPFAGSVFLFLRVRQENSSGGVFFPVFSRPLFGGLSTVAPLFFFYDFFLYRFAEMDDCMGDTLDPFPFSSLPVPPDYGGLLLFEFPNPPSIFSS